MSLNIGGDPHDTSYRYKMPALITKLEGRGNGVHTMLLNICDVGKALHMPPSYLIKYFGIELGTQSNLINDKSNRGCINGTHSAHVLSNLLHRFIHAFVLCPACKLPELTYQISRDTILRSCSACGHSVILNSHHKLNAYMIKNPPTPQQQQQQQTTIQKEMLLEATERTQSPTSRSSSHHPAIMVSDPVVRIHSLLSSSSHTPTQILDELEIMRLARGWDDTRKLHVLLDAAFSGSTDGPQQQQQQQQQQLINVIQTHAPVLRYVVAHSSALAFLCVVEEWLPKHILDSAHYVLQALYDCDIVDEAAILEWYQKQEHHTKDPRALQIRTRVASFIKWLQTTTSEEDE